MNILWLPVDNQLLTTGCHLPLTFPAFSVFYLAVGPLQTVLKKIPAAFVHRQDLKVCVICVQDVLVLNAVPLPVIRQAGYGFRAA